MSYNSSIKHFVTRLDGGVIWAPSTQYGSDNVVIYLDNSYRAVTAHTSDSSFQTDYLAGKWIKLAENVINYISNPRAITDTSGWATYADAAGTAPVDGTGGSPSVTFTRSTTTPLRGLADFNFTKTAVNSQGQGVSTDITIDLADQAKILTVNFDYEILSGTYADGDLTVYLIADPTGTPIVIQPAGYVVQSATIGTKMRQIATFQTQATGQSYRVCFHVASTSASAYALAVDNVVVGPQTVQYGAPVTDWQAYTPSSSQGFGTISSVAISYRRVGDSVQIQGAFDAGTPTATEARIGLPSGLTVDSTKVTVLKRVGSADRNSNLFTVLANGGNSYLNFGHLTTGYTLAETGSNLIGAGNRFQFFAEVPILGWSSTVQMSNDTDTRVVAASYTGNATQALVGGTVTTLTLFGTRNLDTHGAYNSATGVYTVQVPGVYDIDLSWFYNGIVAAGNAISAIIRKNATDVKRLDFGGVGGTTDAYVTSVSYSGSFVAGDTIELRARSTAGITIPNVNGNQFSIRLRQGPSAIAASETVASSYSSSTGQTLNNSVYSWIDFPTKSFDTHGIYTAPSGAYSAASGSWATTQPTWTIPVSGKFQIYAIVGVGVGVAGTTQYRTMSVYKNGVQIKESQLSETSSGTYNNSVSISCLVQCNAGDYIQVKALQSCGANKTLAANVIDNYMDVFRVGN